MTYGVERAFERTLAGGDRRSIGGANAAAAAVRRDPSRFDELWRCLGHREPLVRMRAADALEKYSRTSPAAFEVHKGDLLARTADDGTVEVRWHLIAIVARLRLSGDEALTLCAYLEDRLRHDASRIVKVAALQAAHDVARVHAACEPLYAVMLAFAAASPWPSLRARAARLAEADARAGV